MPLGEYPELTEKGIPITGIGNYGGPLATAGGLIFKAATRDERIRAFDKKQARLSGNISFPREVSPLLSQFLMNYWKGLKI